MVMCGRDAPKHKCIPYLAGELQKAAAAVRAMAEEKTKLALDLKKEKEEREREGMQIRGLLERHGLNGAAASQPHPGAPAAQRPT